MNFKENKVKNIINNQLYRKNIDDANLLPIVRDIFIGLNLVLVKVNNEEKFLNYLIDNNMSYTKIKYEPFNDGNKLFTKNNLYLVTLINNYNFNDFLGNIITTIYDFTKNNKDCIDSTITYICKSNINKNKVDYKVFYEIYDFDSDIKTLTNIIDCKNNDFLKVILEDYITKINNLNIDDYRYINMYLYNNTIRPYIGSYGYMRFV